MPPLVELTLTFKPNVETISTTRRQVVALHEQVVRDPDAQSRIAVTVHELLENALKYSSDGVATLHVRSTVSDEGRARIHIETRNRATNERSLGLQEFFASVGDAADAFTFYQSAMQRSRTRRFGSGLGLARIWAESEMAISLSVDGEMVTVSATGSADMSGEEDGAAC